MENKERRHKLAKKAVVDLQNGTLTIDGEFFPWYISEDGIDVIGLGDAKTIPQLSLAILAESVEVIPKTPRGEGGLDR